MKTFLAAAAFASCAAAARATCQGEASLSLGYDGENVTVMLDSTTKAVAGYEFRLAATCMDGFIHPVDFTAPFAEFPNAPPPDFQVALQDNNALGASFSSSTVSSGLLLKAPVLASDIPPPCGGYNCAYWNGKRAKCIKPGKGGDHGCQYDLDTQTCACPTNLCLVKDDFLVISTLPDPLAYELCAAGPALCPDAPFAPPSPPPPVPRTCDSSICSQYDGKGAQCNALTATEGCLYLKETAECLCTTVPPTCTQAVCDLFQGKGGKCKSETMGAAFGCVWDKTDKSCSCPP